MSRDFEEDDVECRVCDGLGLTPFCSCERCKGLGREMMYRATELEDEEDEDD